MYKPRPVTIMKRAISTGAGFIAKRESALRELPETIGLAPGLGLINVGLMLVPSELISFMQQIRYSIQIFADKSRVFINFASLFCYSEQTSESRPRRKSTRWLSYLEWQSNLLSTIIFCIFDLD